MDTLNRADRAIRRLGSGCDSPATSTTPAIPTTLTIPSISTISPTPAGQRGQQQDDPGEKEFVFHRASFCFYASGVVDWLGLNNYVSRKLRES
jgi:hypothetical protein